MRFVTSVFFFFFFFFAECFRAFSKDARFYRFLITSYHGVNGSSENFVIISIDTVTTSGGSRIRDEKEGRRGTLSIFLPLSRFMAPRPFGPRLWFKNKGEGVQDPGGGARGPSPRTPPPGPASSIGIFVIVFSQLPGCRCFNYWITRNYYYFFFQQKKSHCHYGSINCIINIAFLRCLILSKSLCYKFILHEEKILFRLTEFAAKRFNFNFPKSRFHSCSYVSLIFTNNEEILVFQIIYCVAYTKCVATLWHDQIYLFVH